MYVWELSLIILRIFYDDYNIRMVGADESYSLLRQDCGKGYFDGVRYWVLSGPKVSVAIENTPDDCWFGGFAKSFIGRGFVNCFGNLLWQTRLACGPRC